MKVMMKKGQAAVEFLMTYGWAVLMLLTIVGAFTYLGFTNPDQFLQNKCTVTTGFNCEEVGWVTDTSSGESYIGVYLQNLKEADLYINEVGKFTLDCGSADTDLKLAQHQGGNVYTTPPTDLEMERKTSQLLLFHCPEANPSGKYKLTFTQPYRERRTTFDSVLTGEVTIKGSTESAQYLLT